MYNLLQRLQWYDNPVSIVITLHPEPRIQDKLSLLRPCSEKSLEDPSLTDSHSIANYSGRK